jgi:hypothetical protein
MGLTEVTSAAPVTRRVWPITTLVVIVAFLLMAYQLFVCAIMAVGSMSSELFQGLVSNVGTTSDSPFENGYITAGMACLTSLPAFAALIWCGWQRGSRFGLLLIGVPAWVMGVVGFLALDTARGTNVAPEARRLPYIADLFDDLTLVNWAVVVLFGGFAVVTHLLRRRPRPTQKASAA